MGYDSVQFALETSDVVGFTEIQRLALEMQVLISISNEGSWLYKNLRYPRYRNFYGYCQLMAGAFVVQSIKLEYLNQELFHWDQCCTDLNQSIGCTGKKILANLTPPVTSVVTVYLKRQRYTSVRFRLLPGITANVTLNWRTVEQLCDEELLAPPEDNGKTPLNNNAAPAQPNRPAGQPQDPRDRSKNDGNDDPNDDRPHEPKPGDKPGSGGNWWFTSKFNGGDDCLNPQTSSAIVEGATDSQVQPYFVRTGANQACPNLSDGYIVSNGPNRPIKGSDGTFTFDYRL